MAEPPSLLQKTKLPTKRSPILLPNILSKAVLVIIFALILPLFPSQAPEFINQTILNKVWELLHLLFIGITISYGLFSRKNSDPEPGKDIGFRPDRPNSYVSQFLHGFDDEGEGDEDGRESKVQQTWNNKYYPNQTKVVYSNGVGTSNHGEQTVDKPLFLPVRSLNSQTGEINGNRTHVLPSPIPWRSRSGRLEVRDELGSSKIKSLSSPSPSPKRLSPSPSLSLSRENSLKKKSLYKFSTPPPAPPPPPPRFIDHRYHSQISDRKLITRSFKEELKDVSMRGKADLLRSSSFRPRRSFDGSSSSFSKSVRTIRAKESKNQQITDSSNKISEEPYSYIFYPVQTEESLKDSEIVEKVVFSSDDETESSDSDEAEYSDKDVINSVPTRDIAEKTEEREGNEVDKKADEFIAKFREQIRLQRIESIKRSTAQRSTARNNKQLSQ